MSFFFLISLTNVFKPSFLQCAAPPRLLRKDQQLAEEDKKSQVSCTVDKANPPPIFKWQYQTSNCRVSDCSPDDSQWQPVPWRLLIPPSATPTKKSIVNIERDQVDAFYWCQAFNSLGNASQVIRFVRFGKNEMISFKCFSTRRM